MRWTASYLLKILPATTMVVGLACGALWADDSKRAETRPKVDFVREIQPLLKKYCYQCHGADVQEAGLRLDLKSDALAGGENGKVIVPGDGKNSLLVKLISGADEERFMPPEDEAPPLSKKQVARIRAWIDAGAVWPENVDPTHKKQKTLWSFTPVRRPAIPRVEGSAWVRNSIDAFVLAKLEAANMKPAPPAEPHALIRRAYFDLLGLPPTMDEAEKLTTALAKAPDGSTFQDVIDQLLSNPHYGERWARHWLDLVRYADSNGYEVDGEKPMAWKYRDYVIRALNKDTPYNRFVMEQLAGDELPDASPETVIATGFCRVGPWDAERGASVQPSEKLDERYNELDDMVSTTSQVFLGLTMGCARCHDHKFDPLESHDYYSMVAIFNPLTRHRSGRTELTRFAVPPPKLQEKNEADRRVAELKAKIKSLDAPLRKGLLESGKTKLPAEAVTAFQTALDKRNDAQKKLIGQHTGSFDKEVAAALQQEELTAKFLSEDAVQQITNFGVEIADLEKRFKYPQGYFMFESSPKAPVTHLLKRGNPNQPGPVVTPRVPVAIAGQLGKQQPNFEKPDEFTSRRRISLARWITDPDNPLTARVIVNRVWQYHFGQGIVRSSSDFGHRGSKPTHPELLDWLAHWFVHDANWSLKKLHRLIMTSNTYRMNKHRNDAYAQSDPENRLLWRFPYRRLEVEAIRDSMLAVSGHLNQSLFGPCMYPFIPENARQSGYDPKSVWKEFNEADASRRTIYAYVKRTLVVPFMDTLDFCDTTRSADRRDITTVAPQALELLNGEFVNRQAKHFAERLAREAGNDVDHQIALGYRIALTRSPRPEEQEALKSFWNRERTELLRDDKSSKEEANRRALTQVCRVIFNLNEFVYTD